MPWTLLLLLLVSSVLGCGRADTNRMTTERTVRQAKLWEARGLSEYRWVRMPQKARRNLVEADRNADGVAAYRSSIASR